MKYELVVTNDGKPHLGVSVGTVYQNVQDIVYKIDCIELFNLVYVPRTEEFMFNKKIRLSQGLVDYYESLNLYSHSFIEHTHYASRKDVFQELESIGIMPASDVGSLVRSYQELATQKERVKQKIIDFSHSLTGRQEKK